MASVGVMVPAALSADQFMPFVRDAEDFGFAELWVVEDLGYRGGLAQAAVALSATSRIHVGIGVLPAGAQNPAFAAMEIATLSELFPGRLHVAIGHGMPSWMRSVRAWPDRPVAFLEEYVATLRALLRGEPAPRGREVNCSGLSLENRPSVAPPVLVGARRNHSLQVAGQVADGTVLSEPVTSAFVAAVLKQVSPTRPHKLVAYNLAAISSDVEHAVESVRRGLVMFAQPDWAPQFTGLDFGEEFGRLRKAYPNDEQFAMRIPDTWVRQLALVGSVAMVRDRLRELEQGGVTSNILIPCGEDKLTALKELALVL